MCQKGKPLQTHDTRKDTRKDTYGRRAITRRPTTCGKATKAYLMCNFFVPLTVIFVVDCR